MHPLYTHVISLRAANLALAAQVSSGQSDQQALTWPAPIQCEPIWPAARVRARCQSIIGRRRRCGCDCGWSSALGTSCAHLRLRHHWLYLQARKELAIQTGRCWRSYLLAVAVVVVVARRLGVRIGQINCDERRHTPLPGSAKSVSVSKNKAAAAHLQLFGSKLEYTHTHEAATRLCAGGERLAVRVDRDSS